MSELYMLDTNTVSYIARGRSKAARQRLLQLAAGDAACISVITEAEVRYGLAKRPQATAIRTLMEAFLASISVLPWGRNEAERYGIMCARLEASGTVLSDLDMMIAAHAAASRAILVTNDTALAKVEDLYASTNWATDL